MIFTPKAGNKANVNNIAQGDLAFCKDTHDIFANLDGESVRFGGCYVETVPYTLGSGIKQIDLRNVKYAGYSKVIACVDQSVDTEKCLKSELTCHLYGENDLRIFGKAAGYTGDEKIVKIFLIFT